MIGFVWRFFAALLDWRLHIRKLLRKQILDVVFVTNMRDEHDRSLFLGNYNPPLRHYNGPRLYLRGVSGRTRSICSVSEDILHASTQKIAKEQCIAAMEYSQEKGAKVILLAASTKRLFGDDGKEIKEMFPGLLFTIGDNGTFFLLLSETIRAFTKAGLKPENSKICVIGPYGFLGELMVNHLTKKGFKVIGLGSSQSRLAQMQKKYNIETALNFEELGEVDAVVACTHSKQVRLTKEKIELIRKSERKLLVVDVSEPSNLIKEEYKKSKNVVVRQDAGNGYSPNLKYVLGFITYKMFRLTKGVAFGCFMEAMVWFKAMKDNPQNKHLKELDLFTVNDKSMDIVSELFKKYNVRIPSPRNYGKKVRSFDLNFSEISKNLPIEYEELEKDEIEI